MDKLVEAGVLTAAYRRPPGRSGPGAGRPAKVHARSGGEFMVTVPVRDYELAARLLLQAVAGGPGGQGPPELHAAARKLGAGLGQRHQAEGTPDDGPLPALESVLRERGYEPGQDETGTLRMRNCPFRRLAELQPGVICHLNLALIEGMTAGSGAGSLHPVLDPVPGHCCVAIPAVTPDLDGSI